MCLHSLGNNALCGLACGTSGITGTYTTEGIKALCQWLKGNSTLTSLRCADDPNCPAVATRCHARCLDSRSLDDNNLTSYGQDMSAVINLAESLPQTQLQSLR